MVVLIVIQAAPDIPNSEQGMSNEDLLISIPPSLSEVPPFIIENQSSPGDFQDAMQKVFRENFSNQLSQDENLAIRVLASLQEDLRNLIPALPSLSIAVTTLAEYLPKLFEFLSTYMAHAGNNHSSNTEAGQIIFDEIRTIYPALNKGLENVEHIFPVLGDLLLILSGDLPHLAKAYPTLARHVSAFVGFSKPLNTLPSYKHIVPAPYRSIPEFQKKTAPAPIAAFDAGLTSGLSYKELLEINPSYYFSPSYYSRPSYYSGPSYFSSPLLPVMTVPAQ